MNKLSMEPSRYHLTEPTILLHTAEGARSFGEGWLLMSENEYAKLSAEVEERRQAEIAAHQNWQFEVKSLEAKFTALVEDVKKADAELTEMRGPPRRLTERARVHLRQALAHHSAPVGEAADTGFVDWTQPLQTNETLQTHGHAPRPVKVLGEVPGGTLDRFLIVIEGVGNASHPPGEYAAHKRSGMVRGNLAVINAPPTTPTSAPVEDVGANDEGILPCKCGSYPRLSDDNCRPDDGWRTLWCQTCMEHVTEWKPSAAQAIRDWNAERASLIQPQGEEREAFLAAVDKHSDDLKGFVASWSKPPQGERS